MPQAVKYQTPWMGGGEIQADEEVTVRNVGDTADATVYTDATGETEGDNPITTDSDGLLTAYLAPGRYLLKSADSNERLEITVSTPGNDTPAKPEVTGARDDGTALASLLTALETAGIITDSTTAS